MSEQKLKLPQSYLRAALRVLALVVWIIIMVPVVFLLWVVKAEKARSVLVWYFYRVARMIAGIHLHYEGAPSTERPLMVVSNHTSHFDIFILGSIMRLSFTPKREIRSWPVIGFCAMLGDCVFVERKPADMQRAKAEMAERLNAGKVLALFPEGTTGDGFTVLPFKSGFFNLVETHNLPLQAVSLAYTHIADIPLSAATREYVAWIGEATLVKHMLRLLSFPYIQVTARFYPVERIEHYEDRKALAKACEQMVATGLKDVLEKNGVTG